MGSTSRQTRSRHHFAPLGSKGSGQHGGDNMQLKGIVFDMVLPLLSLPHSRLTNGGQEGEPQNYMFGQMRQAVGIPKEIDILDHIHSLSSSQQEEAFAKIQAIERDAMAKQVPQPGLVTLMEFLDERGILKSICTRNFEQVLVLSSKAQHSELTSTSAPVAHLLANHLPGHIKPFTPIITRDFKPPKPSPAGILHIAHAWGITDTAAVPQTPAGERPIPLIMVGDSIDDMVAGYEAGALTVLLRSEGKEELEVDSRTDVVISRLDELIGLLDGGLKPRRAG